MPQVLTTKRVLLTSLYVDLLDIVTNGTFFFLTGSAVIFAEFLQGLTDFFGTIFLVIGHNESIRPKDHLHPMGYGRDIFFWSLLSSIIMLFVGSTGSMYQGVHQIWTPERLTHSELAIVLLLFSLLSNGYAFVLSLKKIHTPGTNFFHTLRESSQQLVKTSFIRDFLGILAGLVGLIALLVYELTGIVSFDGYGAVGIGTLMALFSIILINQSRHLIVGRTVSKKVLHRIRRSTMTIPEVIDIYRLTGIYIGNDQILVDLDVKLVDHLGTTRVEEVLNQIKETIFRDIPETKSVQIDLNAQEVREKVTIEKVT